MTVTPELGSKLRKSRARLTRRAIVVPKVTQRLLQFLWQEGETPFPGAFFFFSSFFFCYWSYSANILLLPVTRSGASSADLIASSANGCFSENRDLRNRSRSATYWTY